MDPSGFMRPFLTLLMDTRAFLLLKFTAYHATRWTLNFLKEEYGKSLDTAELISSLTGDPDDLLCSHLIPAAHGSESNLQWAAQLANAAEGVAQRRMMEEWEYKLIQPYIQA